MLPFAKVRALNTLVVLGLVLNVNVTAAVLKPPDAVNNGTLFIGVPSVSAIASFSPDAVCELSGSVTPLADTAIVPVPSDEIVAPPKLIVSPARNNSPNRFVALPKFLVPLPSGIIFCATADKSISSEEPTV